MLHLTMSTEKKEGGQAFPHNSEDKGLGFFRELAGRGSKHDIRPCL